MKHHHQDTQLDNSQAVHYHENPYRKQALETTETVMHPNRIYRKESRESNIAFVQSRNFGVLALNGPATPLVSHIPFLLSECGSYVEAHLVRTNPIVPLLEQGPCEAKLIVSGGDSYISPDWYELEDRVPTWNYVAAHLAGRLQLLESGKLVDILDRLSARFEDQLLPKSPWTLAKLTDDTLQKFTRAIVPIALSVDSIEATWKLDQNKPASARASAAGAAAGANIGVEVEWLCDRMLDTCKES